MATYMTDISGISQVDVTGDSSGLAQKWRRWKRSFELYAESRGVADNDQKRALLLHSVGMAVQDIFFTLPAADGDNVYKKAVKALDSYFNIQSNVPYESHMFRQSSQSSTETVEQYITRLRQKAQTCDFTNTDEQIRDQVTEKCYSSRLRRKLLEKGKDLTLKDLRETSRTFENAETQAQSMEEIQEQVNKLSFKPREKPNSKFHAKEIECYKCGFRGHIAKDSRCPAKDKRCRKCKKIGHFEKKCKSGNKAVKSKRRIRIVNQETSSEEEDTEFTFNIQRKYPGKTTISVCVGGIDMKMIIDSGSSSNIVDRNIWEYLKKSGIKCKNEKRSKELYAYGSKQALKVAGLFWRDLKYQDKCLDNVEFVVIEGKGQSLLSCETAITLGVLKIIRNIESGVENADFRLDKYQDVFEGLSKLKGYELKIPIDQIVAPIVQATRRVPFNLRDKLNNTLDELESQDIIERVDGPTSWVSPIVIVPKPNGDIRLCWYMRQANTAVKRVRHPIPTVDEILENLNQSKIFSKLDISMAYHQT